MIDIMLGAMLLNSLLIVYYTGRFTLKLRTSFYSSYPGFRMFVTCVSAKGIGTLALT